jgi:peptide-methionine (R)-S-oxide reductase
VRSKTERSDEEWGMKLTPEEFHILREKGTEISFTGKYLRHKGRGVYVCAGCGAELFRSEAKYESGTGWPSFWDSINGSIELREDRSLEMNRIEVICKSCGGHLGHVFDDGPEPTGKRYCVNSAALHFKEKTEETK